MTNPSSSHTSVTQLIFIPSVITLVVTLLRLVGEIEHWSTALFNPSAGGIGSIVGITWLAIVFGVYFAMRLAREGERPASNRRAVIHAVAGIAIVILGSALGGALRLGFYGQLAAFCLVFAVAALIQQPAWPALFKTLLAYAYAARIPVAILMFFAMRGNWQTHYDAVPPEAPAAMSEFWPKYLWLGLLPQLIAWVGFTILLGSLFGSIAVALAHRRKPARQTAHA